MIKYIRNTMIIIAVCAAAVVLGNATNRNNESTQLHEYDPYVISNITHNIEIVQSDIENLSENIMKCQVSIKFANRCRYGYCYNDIEHLEKDLNHYKCKLRERTYELYCLGKLLTKESEKTDNGLL